MQLIHEFLKKNKRKLQKCCKAQVLDLLLARL